MGFLHVVIRKSSEGKEGRTKIPSILFYYSPFPGPLVAFSLPPSRWDTRLDSVSAHDPPALTTVARLRGASFLRPRASRVLPSRWSGLPGQATSLPLISSSLSLCLPSSSVLFFVRSFFLLRVILGTDEHLGSPSLACLTMMILSAATHVGFGSSIYIVNSENSALAVRSDCCGLCINSDCAISALFFSISSLWKVRHQNWPID